MPYLLCSRGKGGIYARGWDIDIGSPLCVCLFVPTSLSVCAGSPSPHKPPPQVVAAGGLLVLGTSLQEGERIELQLRGRAGRQGDPGTTHLMFDVSDPLITNYGMQSECDC